MILSTGCGVCGEMKRVWTYRALVKSWQHITNHALFAVPFDTSARASACLPRHLFLKLSQRVLRNISRFWLRAHKLRVETTTWNSETSPLCDRCDCAQVQDEVQALLMCRDLGLCAPRRKYAHLFSQFAGDFSVQRASMIARSYLTQPVSFLCLSLWICSASQQAVVWRGPVTGRSAEQPGLRSPHVI